MRLDWASPALVTPAGCAQPSPTRRLGYHLHDNLHPQPPRVSLRVTAREHALLALLNAGRKTQE